MTKKKPSPQNRIWEKERRERLNKTFEDLHRLLPDNEPSATLTKVEILQRAIELIGKLQKKVKDLMQECNDPLKDQINEQETRLKRLLGRNDELVELLRKAKIAVPPCSAGPPEEESQQHSEEKENGNRGKTTEMKGRRSGGAAKKQSVINQKHSASLPSCTVGSDVLALSAVKSVAIASKATPISVSNSCPGGVQSASSSSALKHINGISIGPGHGVNVTSALLSTPIMTTSVLISNNGNLLQMPIVAPPSSLLIVGSEDVRAKINLKNRHPVSSGNGKTKRGKFMIKSIDVIPGRIVNGKIPIPPLRRSKNELSFKGSQMSKLKRKTQNAKTVERSKKSRKLTVESFEVPPAHENDPTVNKRSRLAENQIANTLEVTSNDNQQPQEVQQEPPITTRDTAEMTPLLATEDKPIRKEDEKSEHTNSNIDPSPTHLDHINLSHQDLSEDIFANLQVPDDSTIHTSHDDGSLSPTAAYLMNFPLVAGGGKAAGNHIETGDVDECDEGVTVAELQTAKKDSSSESMMVTGSVDTSGSVMLDNFTSFFNYGQMESIGVSSTTVGQEESMLQSGPVTATMNVATVTTLAAAATTRESGFSTYTTSYQSIDNMLEHRPVVPNRATTGATAKVPMATEPDYAASVAFTFTLTSSTSAASTTSQTSTLAPNHFLGPSCGAVASNPVKSLVDDFNSPLKPSIEFTFSLTSTTGSQPRTVQSQYTNSAILATTMTTPSYDTYGYYHKTTPQTANYCPSFGVLDPLLTTEKPATSFTFSLTSSTKTEPAYTHSSFAPVPTHTSQAYETVPKLSTKHLQQGTMECHTHKNGEPAKLEKVSHRTQGTTSGAVSHADGHANVLHQQSPVHTQQQISSSGIGSLPSTALQQNSQSRYDVPWMAAGTHNDAVTTTTNHHPIHHSQQHQQAYDLAPAQILATLDYPVPPGGYSASYKSDIFFAHPPGEENNLTWSSPSKLSNILNDSSSPYFPPVTLPSLNGDLALNTSVGAGLGTGTNTGSTANYKMGMTNAKKGHMQGGVSGIGQSGDSTPGSSFLSVSQLVNQPSKSSNHGHSNAANNCVQKPLNNNYSAEALIGNHSYNQNSASTVSTGHEPTRKDKLFDYGCNIMDSGFGSSAVSSNTSLTFNFDTYGAPSGADYNKGYNFSTQPNTYVPAFATDGSGYGSVPGGSGCTGSDGAGGTTGLPYYGKHSAQGYYSKASGSSSASASYPHSSFQQTSANSASSAGQDFTPYYLPTFGEKHHEQQQDQRLQPQHHYGSALSERSSTLSASHKISSAVGHNYRQISSSVVEIGSAKSSKNTQHDKNHQHHDLTYAPTHAGNHSTHTHLDLTSCLNAQATTVNSDGPIPQAPVSYGSSVSNTRQHTSTQMNPSQHLQRHEQQSIITANTVPQPIGHIGSVGGSASGSCGTITNFNLSTICPEINDKTGRARDVSKGLGVTPVPLSVASIMTHW